MNNFIKTLCAAALLIAPTVTLAEPKPEGAKRADPQSIANFYVGKSQTWRSCNGGGIYYDSNWEARAYCNEDGPAIGIGTWSVSAKGIICHDLTWYWQEGDGVGSRKKPVSPRNCDELVMDADGNLWARWQLEKNNPDAWWNVTKSKNISKGDAFKRKVNRLRRKTGV